MMLIVSNKTSVLFSFIFLFTFSLHFFPFLSSAADQQLVPALYVFGDSFFDSSNNNRLPTTAKANYWPYGINFEQANGRFTNGKTAADFIAEYLGLPHPPPYLRTRKHLPLTGLNFASGSCGILPKTGSPLGKCLSFEEQVGLFGDSVKWLQQRYFNGSEEEVSNYLSKSIFIISVGGNDYLNNYLEPSLFNTSKHYSPQQFAQLLSHRLSHQLERLYNFGARKIVVFEVGAIGCIPYVRRKYGHKGQVCVEDKNQLVSHYNKLLPPLLQNLTSSLEGSTFVNALVESLGRDAIINPSKYGFEDGSKPCCTTLFKELSLSECIPSQKLCRDADKKIFWDGYHPTEHVHSLVASLCINHTSFCIPFNLNRLVKI